MLMNVCREFHCGGGKKNVFKGYNSARLGRRPPAEPQQNDKHTTLGLS